MKSVKKISTEYQRLRKGPKIHESNIEVCDKDLWKNNYVGLVVM